ncbi:MAG: DUF2207 domain-containing protein, partial [Verrucomicrobia bacterium]|nr:DUF2207 domain-containing protein [Verrucomicrobiota bacterium]
MRRILGFGLLVGFLGVGSFARADERIVEFRSDIHVHADSTMTVTERITVQAENKQINRGIFRDFPTRYRDRYGNHLSVGFTVKDVRRDGQPENYRVENLSNGRRVRIGRKEVLLSPGVYTYAITYDTSRQLGFFEKHDELYWNVTGTDWAFPIDTAIAVVTLPAGIAANAIQVEGYTGPQGAKGADLQAEVDAQGRAQFVTTRPLGEHEGLTIVAMWPKGFVTQPSRGERAESIVRDNPTLRSALIGFGLLLGYYMISWFAVGRDPARGTIIPRFLPPQGLSPAAARFVMRMKFDNHCFTAALINLAVRRWVDLRETKGVYTVSRVKGTGGTLSPGEGKVFAALLGARESLALKQTHHATIAAAVDALRVSLKAEHAKQNFRTNGKYLAGGIVIAVLTLLAILADAPEAGFLGLWLSMWSIGVVVLLRGAVTQWRAVLHGPSRITGTIGALFFTLFMLPFLAAEVFVTYMFAMQTSLVTALVLILMVVAIWIFHQLLKARTRVGRVLMDEVEGFRRYLSVAEEDRLASLHPPEKTPELFEAYLPYALALGVEQQWAEKFSAVLEAAGKQADDGGYQPVWYHTSSHRGLGPALLAGAVGGALASAVASSSTAPGSSSGGGGGGSSGGGGV